LSFSPDGATLVIHSYVVRGHDVRSEGVRFVDIASRTSRLVHRTRSGDLSAIGWSPDGRRFAFRQGRSIRVLDALTRRPARTLLVDSRLDSDASTQRWLTDGRLALVLFAEKAQTYEIATLEVDGRRTVIARIPSYWSSPEWSVDGGRVAYARRTNPRTAVWVADTHGGSRRVVLRAASVSSLRWSPDGRLVVAFRTAKSRARVAIVGARGSVAVDGASELGGWSDDGRFLDVGLGEVRGVLDLASRRIRRLPLEGNVQVIEWVPGSAGPATAPVAEPLPAIHTASGVRLRSRGSIAEISASGWHVSAIVRKSSLDCDHIVAWQPGHSTVVRFVPPKRCPDESGYLAVVKLGGLRVVWYRISYGNSSYWDQYAADVRRPRSGVRHLASFTGEHGEEPGAPPPERGEVGGVAMEVRSGSVVITRTDGRTRTIRPPGGAVDAELEPTGLFYAFNGRGALPGTIVFVPFAKLFA
jgi:dipeptidyl aminopeptidase/acylaminoacyl peptidase